MITSTMRQNLKPCIRLRNHQSGASLVVVLMILVVVSVLGIGGAQIALMGEKSARNDTNYQIAWEAAEAGLSDAEIDIDTDAREPGVAPADRVIYAKGSKLYFVSKCGANGTIYSGLCQTSVTAKFPDWQTVDLVSSGGNYTEFGTFTGRTFKAGSTGIQPAQKPRYVIEVVTDSSSPTDVVYRITSMGFGPRSDIQAVMQETYRKAYSSP